MKRFAIAAICALATCSACSSDAADADVPPPTVQSETATPTPEPLQASVYVALPHPFALAIDDRTCSAGPEYADIESGAQVQIKDAAGTVVATGVLDLREAIPGEHCIWQAGIAGIEPGGEFYTVNIGDFASDSIAEDDIDKIILQPAKGENFLDLS